ncbi:MAG TPA: beta-ketoacyl synthase N-terminal-like domain-containing protein [Planctomycetota bacterium]
MVAEIAITGVGMVTPLGADAVSSSSAWHAGESAQKEAIAGLDQTRLAGSCAARLPHFDPAARLGSRRMIKYMSDAALLGCLAAHEAIEAAQLKRRIAPERIGLFAATGLAAASVDDVIPMLSRSIEADGAFSCRLFGEKGLAAANPLLSFKILANMPPCLVSIIEAVKGPNLIFNPWEGQTGAAFLEAWYAVADGMIDAAVVGAADNPAHAATFVYLRSAGLLAASEFPAAAAGYVVLERAELARSSGQTIRAILERPELRPSAEVADPLAQRIGRTFAAAPAVLMALTSYSGGAISVSGVDHQCFTGTLRLPT